MTLNLTVLTSERIVHSSDFLITSEGTRDVLSDTTMKVVTLSYERFDGIIVYTGIAWDGQHSTARAIVEWLKDRTDIALHEIVDILRARGSELIRRDAKGGPPRKLIISVAVFRDGRPVAVKLTPTRRNPMELEARWYSPKKWEIQPHLIVSGQRDCVGLEDERVVLEAFESTDREGVSALIALNKKVSADPRSKGTVGDECTVLSMNRYGAGAQFLTGDAQAEFFALSFGMYIDTNKVLGLPEGAVRSGSVLFNTSKAPPQQPTADSCSRTLIDLMGSSYETKEVFVSEGPNAGLLDINVHGRMIGVIGGLSDTSHAKYWTWAPDEELETLPYAAPSACGAVNDKGEMALMLEDSDSGKLQPAVISGNSSRVLEMPQGMTSPSITCINNHGQVGGSICINADESDNSRQKPAVWFNDSSIVILTDIPASESGLVEDINDSGVAAVVGHTLSFVSVVVAWDTAANEATRLLDDAYCHSIGNDGSMVATGSKLGYTRRATLIYNPQVGWQTSNLKDGYYTMASAAPNILGGIVSIDGGGTPWIHETEQKYPSLLPKMEEHNGSVVEIAHKNLIAGYMSGESHQHLVIWRRK